MHRTGSCSLLLLLLLWRPFMGCGRDDGMVDLGERWDGMLDGMLLKEVGLISSGRPVLSLVSQMAGQMNGI